MTESAPVDAGRLRLDKWLWYARFFKSRTQASASCNAGRIRVNGQACIKANVMIKPADVLTFAQGPYVRVIEIVALGGRRGPAPEAQALYRDLSPPEEQPRMSRPLAIASRNAGAGRPTKRDRRLTDRLREGE